MLRQTTSTMKKLWSSQDVRFYLRGGTSHPSWVCASHNHGHSQIICQQVITQLYDLYCLFRILHNIKSLMYVCIWFLGVRWLNGSDTTWPHQTLDCLVGNQPSQTMNHHQQPPSGPSHARLPRPWTISSTFHQHPLSAPNHARLRRPWTIISTHHVEFTLNWWSVCSQVSSFIQMTYANQ